MKRSGWFIILLILPFIGFSQETGHTGTVGDTYILKAPSGTAYKHINFPRSHNIIKRGAIPNFNALVGEKLIVQGTTKNKDGSTTVVLQRKNGRKFFRFFPTVTAHMEKALAQGELKTVGQ